MNLGLEGKVAVITGGSDGIGKAAALSMSREGVRVAIAARDQSRLDAAVANISDQTQNRVLGISTDVRDEDSVRSLISQVVDEWGGIDILVNNAGTSSTSRLEDMSNEIMTADIELKVYGAVLKKSDSGVIINTTTPGGKAPAAGTQPTALSRAAGISLTKTWSKELAEFNIRVNTICIGLIKSGQHRASWARMHEDNSDYSLDDHWQKLSQVVPLGRVGEADEAGDVICFLASPKASYITGTSVNIDGGLSPVV
ncbi:MAG TPA: SDR family oxidoreductase [Gammaproteobacteria bacterium]|nr:SDR family oxidoreductase [Gammaproteobacteria bacterium]